ncbi:response regulator [Thaumasiovibrio subtropicus]|uniref:response regulator n=1 Tax=Thaumasiovibrio subtropicus TaxID=1891207 RepID=UPI000B356A6D|nr:response regulator [Thaumasiovibrio subtropicus]
MNILICDDSPMVRNRLAACLDPEWDIETAENGWDALMLLERKSFDLLFLDLTMPVMDGFALLEELQNQHIQLPIVVISADIQPEARKRCLQSGAVDFINKPFQKQDVHDVVKKYLYVTDVATSAPIEVDIDYKRQLKEISNVALGRGAAVIARQLGEFINMPLPKVGEMPSSEIVMLIDDIRSNKEILSVSQRFVGGGIHGEALVAMQGKDKQKFVQRLGCDDDHADSNEKVLDLANLLVSTFLVSLSQQVLIEFSLRPPVVVESALMEQGMHTEKESEQGNCLSIEYSYTSADSDFHCDVLFLMDEGAGQRWEKVMRTV